MVCITFIRLSAVSMWGSTQKLLILCCAKIVRFMYLKPSSSPVFQINRAYLLLLNEEMWRDWSLQNWTKLHKREEILQFGFFSGQYNCRYHKSFTAKIRLISKILMVWDLFYCVLHSSSDNTIRYFVRASPHSTTYNLVN